MPGLFRAMLADGEFPRVGDQKFMLGVRVGKPPRGDVELTEQQTVLPRTGGMSVGPDWRELPYFLIPPRLAHLVADERKRKAAIGNNLSKVWRHQSAKFADGFAFSSLALRLDSEKHGVVEPPGEVAIDVFQYMLAATKSDWLIDEE